MDRFLIVKSTIHRAAKQMIRYCWRGVQCARPLLWSVNVHFCQTAPRSDGVSLLRPFRIQSLFCVSCNNPKKKSNVISAVVFLSIITVIVSHYWYCGDWGYSAAVCAQERGVWWPPCHGASCCHITTNPGCPQTKANGQVDNLSDNFSSSCAL